MHGDRVALVAFAGVAFIETPLTLDYGAFRSFLNLLQPGAIPVKGSNIELALKKSLEALGIKDGQSEVSRGAAVILLTDGEELDGDLTSYGDIARAHGVKIYVLGIGTPEGAPIPSPDGYKKDRDGRVVITRLHPDVLEKIALQTGGTYVQSIGSPKDIEAIYNSSLQSSLTQSDRDWASSKRWHEYYQLPLGVALLLLLFGPWGRIPAAFRKAALLFVFASPLLSSGNAAAQTAEAIGAEAKKQFESGNFSGAEDAFARGHEKAPQDSRMLLGLGASRYRKGNFKDAQQAFADAAKTETEPVKKAGALYNLGNSFVQDEHYEEAIKSYESALNLTPADQEIKDNLAYAKKLLEQQKQQKKEQQKNQQNKNDKHDKSSKDEGADSEKSDQGKGQKEEDQQKSESDKQDEKDQSESAGSSSSNSNDQQNGQSSAEASPTPSDQQDQNGGSSSQSSEESDQNSSEQSGEAAEPTPAAEGSSSSASGTAASAGSENTSQQPNGQEALDTLINSVQERQDANNRFRMGQALKQLKAEKRKLPEKDW